ncbi:hypothetical protein [Gordonia caeni]|uniref:Helix-turn-helix DNA binding domain protein n=1 Tax=Gordonia caeni TaxID=1007097 RepID=A0ABP7PBM1_9ACTN
MRIRSIKPEFWRDETVVDLSISARLTFIGLWSYVDDNGVGDARVSAIVADLYADDMSRDPRECLARVSDDLEQLSATGLILIYDDPTHPRRSLLFIRQWARHQKIDRPSKGHGYTLPTGQMLDEADTRAMLATPSRVSRANVAPGTGEQGSRGTGEVTHASHLRAAGADTANESPSWNDDRDAAERATDHRHAAIAQRQRDLEARAAAERAEIDDCDLCDDRGYWGGRVCTHDPELTDRAARGIAAARAALTRKDPA